MFDESAGIGPDAAAGKRSLDVIYDVGPELKKFAADAGGDTPAPIPQTAVLPAAPQTATAPAADAFPAAATTPNSNAETQATTDGPPTKDPASRARQIRLEQNRKAARESRRRKKVMIEELQRSVIFFSRANSTLKQQNEELARVLLKAQAKVKAVDEGKEVESLVFSEPNKQPHSAQDSAQPTESVITLEPSATAEQHSTGTAAPAAPSEQEQQAQAQAVATQAMLESQGFPAAAARMAAQTMNAGSMSIPAMQPGATMQAMANFQTACAQAMQAAIQGMQGVPGLNLAQMQAVPMPGINIQQAYTDQMTALAMQQAAAAQMGAHHFMFAAPLLAGNAMWAANSAAAAAAAQPPATASPSVKETTEETGDEAAKEPVNA